MHPFKAISVIFFPTLKTQQQPLLSSPVLVCSLALLSPFIFLRAAFLYLPIDLLCSINMLECQLESPSCPSARGELQHISKSFSGFADQQLLRSQKMKRRIICGK